METTPIVNEPAARAYPLTPVMDRRVTSRVSWGAIFAGSVISVGVWLLLHVLGIGVGLTAINPDDAGSLKGVGIGTGIWSLIAPLIALFVGGLVTGRLTGVFDRPLGAIHGAVVWSLTTIAGIALLISAIGSAVSGTARVAGTAFEGATGMARSAGAMRGDTLGALGLRGEDLVAPINRELRSQGKPPVEPEELEAATQDVMRDAIRQGRLDRDLLISSIVDHTRLSPNQAGDVASQIEQRYEAQKERVAAALDEARTDTLQAAETTGKGLLMAFASMLLALAASIGGAIAGVSWLRRQVSRPRAAA
jgi:hypothetical protein